MNLYALTILVVLLGEYALSIGASMLNLRALSPDLPDEFTNVFDKDTYTRSQTYTQATTRFSLVRSTINLTIVLTFWQQGGFEWVDQIARSAGYGPILTGLLFMGTLGLLTTLLSLPFQVYGTFVLESRFGFNRTSPATFVTDLCKSLILTVVLGGTLMTGILFFFSWAGSLAWLWCWFGATVFIIVVQFVAPTWIMPIFNTFTPLDSGELRNEILAYAKSVDFPLKDIFVVDGSKRSSKANAFFTGLGRNKRIGLFDTLVENYSVHELVSIVAHEVGHYKKGHIVRGLALQIIYLGGLFFILSAVLGQEKLFQAFQMTEMSVYAGLVFFGLLFTPVEMILSMYVNAVSRRNEFEADAFAANTTGNHEPLITALKKLTADSLGNLTPHPIHVFLHYSHPPVLQRIEALRKKS